MREHLLKKFQGKYGEINLYEYIEENGKTEYRVTHSSQLIGNCWFVNKLDAILHYQFLCYKY